MKNEENHQDERQNYEFWLQPKCTGETVLALWGATGTRFHLLS